MTMTSGIARFSLLAVTLLSVGCLTSDGSNRPGCEFSPASYVTYATEAELNALLIGRWQRCTAPQSTGEDVGVEFAMDGRWYPLTQAGGTVVRRTGVAYGGAWQYLPPGAINVISGQPDPDGQFMLSGGYTDPPKFTDGPRQLRVFFSPVLSIYTPLP
jgi:hypothetical protein